MKILIFEDSAVLGGTKRSLAEFAAAAGRDAEVVVYAPSSPLASVGDDIRLIKLRLPAKPYRPIGRLLLTIYETLALTATVIRESPDCVITMNLRGHLAGGLIAMLTRARVGWYLLDYTPTITRIGRLLPFLSRYIRQAAVLSDAQKRAFTGYLRCPLVTIPPGIDTNVMQAPGADEKSESRRCRSLPAGRVLVGMVSRIAPHKGLEGFIETAGCLDDDRFVFVITGQPGDAAYLEEVKETIARSHSRTSVILRKPTADRSMLYGPLDICLLPFVRAEGFGRAVLESMASGLPTVVSDVEPMREIITDASDGFIVPPGDIQRSVEVLKSLADPDLRRRIGGQARRTALSRFSLERYQSRVRTFLEVFMNTTAAAANTHT
ncbi:MAG: glycosyltransferase family 4 protein [Candidatus Eisenbacteria bacterium]